MSDTPFSIDVTNEQFETRVGRGDGAARERMLTLFDRVDDAALVAHYRRQLFNALY